MPQHTTPAENSAPVTLNPGPAQLWGEVGDWMQNIYQSGLLSQSHRSPAFIDTFRGAQVALRRFLGIPDDYAVLFLGSATECWTVLTEGLLPEDNPRGLHVVSGAFSQRWFDYAHYLRPNCQAIHWSVQNQDFKLVNLPNNTADFALLALTQNETSNGSQLPLQHLDQLRSRYPNTLIAVDGTSSLAGLALPINWADCWFASVQKCFGLPAGLGVLALSPRAQERAKDVNERKRHNGLQRLVERAEAGQTNHTPNMLGIALVEKAASQLPGVEDLEELLLPRTQKLYDLLDAHSRLEPWVQHKANRSQTVLCFQGEPELLEKLEGELAAEGIRLGGGYGDLKKTTRRIANFPAVPTETLEVASQILEKIR